MIKQGIKEQDVKERYTIMKSSLLEHKSFHIQRNVSFSQVYKNLMSPKFD